MAEEEEARLDYRADIKLSILGGSVAVKWAGINPATPTTSSHLRGRRGAPVVPCSGIDQRYVPAGVGYLSPALTIFHAALSIKQQIKNTHTHINMHGDSHITKLLFTFLVGTQILQSNQFVFIEFSTSPPRVTRTHTHVSTGNLLKDIHFEYMP